MIRQQRHYGARIIITTQEPSISPKLLDLCTICIVHRFSSPAWLQVLQQHIGALSSHTRAQKDADHRGDSRPKDFGSLLQQIVDLKEGEAYVFAPAGVVVRGEFKEEHPATLLDSNGGATWPMLLEPIDNSNGLHELYEPYEPHEPYEPEKLGMGYLKVKVRQRITQDGGMSKMAK